LHVLLVALEVGRLGFGGEAVLFSIFFGGFGGDMTGIQDTTVNGQYMGGAGRYNPSPFAPGAFQNRNPWAGL
jgi:hypothetical protein